MAEQTARPVNVEEMATVAHHVLADAEASHMAMAVAEAIAKHLATPVPEIAPGTAGTATVRGVEGVRVMRIETAPGDGSEWASERPIAVPNDTDAPIVTNWHLAEHVIDFVPDDADRWRRHVLAIEHDRDEARAEVERLRHTNAQLQENLRAAEHRLATAPEPRPAFVLPGEGVDRG